MAWRRWRSACKTLQSEAKMVDLTVVVHAARYLGVLDSSLGLEAIIIKLKVRDMAQNLRVGPEFPSMP